MTKKVFVVLGVARSGTSLIASALHALGVDLGSNLKTENKWNPKGFWEDNEFMFEINEKILQQLHSSWDSVKCLDLKNNKQCLKTIKEKAIDLLHHRFANTDYWGFKDPRTARLIPFWQMIFAECNMEEHYVITLRNPLSSACSYQKLMETDLEHGLILWMVHMHALIEDSMQKKRVIVAYDLLMKEPRQQLLRLQKKLHLENRANPEAIEIFLTHFFDKKLVHFDHTIHDLESNTKMSVAPLALSLYHLLLKVAKDEMEFDTDEFKNEWQKINEQFTVLLPIYSYLDVLLQRNLKLQQFIFRLQKSRLWKVMYPFRKMNDFFRLRRKRKSAAHLPFLLSL